MPTEAMSPAIQSPWRGSAVTAENVRQQVRERWGETEAERFDPLTHAMPFVTWASFGFKVRKGEKALKSITFIDTDEVGADGGRKKIRRVVNLFHVNQVEKA